jgi:hypothetical protein
MEGNAQTPQQEKKEERIDELDIIGGSIFNLLRGLFSKFTSLFTSKKAE